MQKDSEIMKMTSKDRCAVESDDNEELCDVDDIEEKRDADGAIWLGQVGVHESFGEGRWAKIAPVLAPPSEEMVRRHKAAGHCPYRAWCKECVMGACNMPVHPARKDLDPGATPELHGDYAFFRDRPGEKDKTRTVLVMADR